MADIELRRLERAAQSGDPVARGLFEAAEVRAGRREYVDPDVLAAAKNMSALSQQVSILAVAHAHADLENAATQARLIIRVGLSVVSALRQHLGRR